MVAFAYASLLLEEPEYVRPEPGSVHGGRGAGHRAESSSRSGAGRSSLLGRDSSPSAPAASTAAALPQLRPAVGSVAASAPGRGSDEEREGFLRTLAEGPDFRRAAAATALGLHCAGSADPAVLSALLDAVHDEGYETLIRVEAILALYQVVGQALPDAMHGELRQHFPEGVDWDFVRVCQRRVEDADL